MMKRKSVCFFGQDGSLETIVKKGPESLDRLKEAIIEAVRTSINDGYRDYVCGMRPGFDLFAAAVIGELMRGELSMESITLVALLPYKGFQYAKGDPVQVSFCAVYNDLANIRLELEPKDAESPFVAQFNYIIERSGRMICLFDDDQEPNIHHARRKGLELINLKDKVLPVKKRRKVSTP